jgi:hypothetical protein
VEGRKLALVGRKLQEPPAGTRGTGGSKSTLDHDLLLRILCVLSDDHIKNLAGPRTGAHGRERILHQHTAPLLKSYLATLLRTERGGERDALYRVVDLLVGSGLVPPRVRVAEGAVDWTGCTP